MDYCSLFRDGTIGGLNLKRRHQSGLNVMPPKRIRNNDFPTNLVPTERCLASWESQWSCYMFTWPLLSPPSIIGEKRYGPLHCTSWEICRHILFFSFLAVERERDLRHITVLKKTEFRKNRKEDISLYCRSEDNVPVILWFSPQFLVLLRATPADPLSNLLPQIWRVKSRKTALANSLLESLN